MRANVTLAGLPPTPVARRAWVVIVLCGLAGMIFFLDRQTLSVLKTTLKQERGWTDVDYGELISVFMLCYTTCYLFTGRWVDRWGTRFSLPFFLGLMSLAMLISGASRTWGEMAAGRALLGLAEAGLMPTLLVAIFTWFPPERRGLAATMVDPIYIIGQIAATPIAVIATRWWSWSSAFFIPAGLGIGVALVWWRVDRQPGKEINASRVPPVSYRETLRRREIWGVILARLISDPVWFFLIYWEAGYLQESLGLSLVELGKVGWIPMATGTAGLILAGTLSDRLVVRLGWTSARSRRVLLQTAAMLSPVLALIPWTHNRVAVIGLLCLARIMSVIWLNFTNVFMGELVPPKLIGTAIALMSAFGAATGLICNSLIGPVVMRVGYVTIFAVAACLHPLAAFVLWKFYGKGRSAPSHPALAVEG